MTQPVVIEAEQHYGIAAHGYRHRYGQDRRVVSARDGPGQVYVVEHRRRPPVLRNVDNALRWQEAGAFEHCLHFYREDVRSRRVPEKTLLQEPKTVRFAVGAGRLRHAVNERLPEA